MPQQQAKLRICIGVSIIAGAMLGGCATGRIDLLKSGRIHVEPIVSDDVQFSRVSVHRVEDEVIVYGQAGRRERSPSKVCGTVVISIVAPDGDIMKSSEVRPFPGTLPLRRSHRSHFKARFSDIPPWGSLVRLEFRSEDPR